VIAIDAIFHVLVRLSENSEDIRTPGPQSEHEDIALSGRYLGENVHEKRWNEEKSVIYGWETLTGVGIGSS